jgi:hypothetical protein
MLVPQRSGRTANEGHNGPSAHPRTVRVTLGVDCRVAVRPETLGTPSPIPDLVRDATPPQGQTLWPDEAEAVSWLSLVSRGSHERVSGIGIGRSGRDVSEEQVWDVPAEVAQQVHRTRRGLPMRSSAMSAPGLPGQGLRRTRALEDPQGRLRSPQPELNGRRRRVGEARSPTRVAKTFAWPSMKVASVTRPGKGVVRRLSLALRTEARQRPPDPLGCSRRPESAAERRCGRLPMPSASVPDPG